MKIYLLVLVLSSPSQNLNYGDTMFSDKSECDLFGKLFIDKVNDVKNPYSEWIRVAKLKPSYSCIVIGKAI